MTNKSIIVCILVISGMLMGAPTTQAQGTGGLLGGLLGTIIPIINGTVFCTANGTIGVNGTATPVFPNALVQLRCGNTVVASTTTNSSGVFTLVLSLLQNVLTLLIQLLFGGCRIVVATPLSTCNASLPSVGGLVGTLSVIGTTVQGLINFLLMTVSGFTFNAVIGLTT